MKNLNILVVEDGQSQREMLRDFLRKEGHTVAEADSGEAAVQSVSNGPLIWFSWITKCRAWTACRSSRK